MPDRSLLICTQCERNVYKEGKRKERRLRKGKREKERDRLDIAETSQCHSREKKLPGIVKC